MSITSSTQDFMNYLQQQYASFDLKKWTGNLGGTSQSAIQLASYFGISIAAGFLIKRYAKQMLLCLLLAIFIIKTMEYGQLLHIDWPMVQQISGINPAASLQDVYLNLFTSVKNNFLTVSICLVGFLIGHKLG